MCCSGWRPLCRLDTVVSSGNTYSNTYSPNTPLSLGPKKIKIALLINAINCVFFIYHFFIGLCGHIIKNVAIRRPQIHFVILSGLLSSDGVAIVREGGCPALYARGTSLSWLFIVRNWKICVSWMREKGESLRHSPL